MGREIRRVPPTWEHPKRQQFNHRGQWVERFQPMFDRSYTEACNEWEAEHELWKKGETWLQKEPELELEEPLPRFFWDAEGMPPDKTYYFPEWPAETRTAYCVYENVSEGTPVSPVFETADALEEWLVGQGMSKEAAQSFIGRGWTFSGIASPATGVVFGMNEVAEALK